jgi:hypothetical protein
MLRSTTPRPRRHRVIKLSVTLLAGLTMALAGLTPARADGPDHSPLPWTVKLTASMYTVPGNSTVLLAETNRDLSTMGGHFWVQIYDLTTGLKAGGCNTGTSCYVDAYNVPFAFNHMFVAYVGPLSATPPANAIAESGPIFVTWSTSGFTLTLMKAGSSIQAWSNKLINGHGVLEIRNAYTNALLTSCSTGFVCTASGWYGAYVAFLVPWGIAASSNTLYY